jgi:superfamily II DNA or RNA helicase
VRLEDGGEFTRKWEKTLPAALRAAKETMTEKGYEAALDSLMDADGAKGLVLEHMLQHTEECVYELIVKLASDVGDSNMIVFAHHTEYIAELERRFREAYPDRPVWKITGTTAPKKRKAIQDELAGAKGGILVASYGCVGTGLTLKNIDYGIFAEGFKSKIINKQSIGRGLCLAPGKDLFRLWDVCVRYESGRMMRLGDKRRRLWQQEGFDCERTEWTPGEPPPKFFM